jgi:hypothetical protein
MYQCQIQENGVLLGKIETLEEQTLARGCSPCIRMQGYASRCLTYAIILYSLRSILLFANMNVSTTKMCLDTSVLAKSITGRREYEILSFFT